MKKIVSIMVACSLMASAMPSIASAASTSTSAKVTISSTSSSTFKDVKGHWAEKSILNAYKKGIIAGFPDGTFRPNETVKTDQFVKMVIYSLAERDSKGKLQWASRYLKDLDSSVRYNLNASTNHFDLNSVKSDGHWAAPYLNQGNIMEIISKSDPVYEGRFDGNLTREVAAHILNNTLGTYEFEENVRYASLASRSISDIQFISPNLSFDVQSAVVKGLLRGFPDGTFRPKGYVTRAEAVVMLNRLLDTTSRNPYKPSTEGMHIISFPAKGGTKTVIFQSKEFVTQFAEMKKLMPLTKGFGVHTEMNFSFYANKNIYTAYQTEFQGPNGIMAVDPAQISYGIGRSENDYFLNVDVKSDYTNLHGQVINKFSDVMFSADSAKFQENLSTFAISAKTQLNSMKPVDLTLNKRTVRIMSIQGTSKITVFISQQR